MKDGGRPERLGAADIAEVVASWPAEACELAMSLRDFVLDVAPEVCEGVAFHALCYYKADQPYGKIGGNVCMIGLRKDELCLGFIHGAFLPDPHGLLQGSAKSARHVVVTHRRDYRRPEIEQLIRAAVDYQP